jgi:site-specific DNA-methyltransferase (adenine-specific)
MKTLEDNSIQFIMADPPYLISEENTSKYKLLNEEWDKGEEIIYDCIKEFKRILKRGGSLIIWYDVWKISYLKECLEENKFKQIRLVEWLKKNSPPIASNNSYLPNSKEYFVYGAKNTSYLKQWFKAPFNHCFR